jgi:hypothetical protein
MANEQIDFSKYFAGMRAQTGGRADSEEVSRQMHPERETRPQLEKEHHPDWFERQKRERGR